MIRKTTYILPAGKTKSRKLEQRTDWRLLGILIYRATWVNP